MYFADIEYRLDVRPNDLDSLGHVNNAVVLEYLEAGRWLAHYDLGGRGRIVTVVSRIEVDYVKEIGPQTLLITTRLEPPDDLLNGDAADLEAITTYKAVIRQRIFISNSRTPAVQARVVIAFLDLKTRSLCSLQDYLAAAGSASSSLSEGPCSI